MKLFWFLALVPTAGLAQVTFTKLTLDPVMQSTATTPAAFADFNQDGWIDLYLGVFNGVGFAYTNNGNGSFTRITNGGLTSIGAPNFGAAWGDFDNDGWPDLFVGVNSGGNDVVLRNVAGTFTRLTSQQFPALGGNANNVAWADYDNDGFLDAFSANSDQTDFLLHNEGNGSFARVLTNAIATEPGNSQGAAWGDYDDDGLLDLVITRVNVPTLLYRNLGGGSFLRVTNNVVTQATGVSQGVTWVDYDNDGRLDLFIANPNSVNWLYHNDGSGQFSRVTNAAMVADSAAQMGCAWADYDNDGWLDLFIAVNGGQSQLYHNEGGTFTRITTGLPATDSGSAFAAAWGDINNDGFQDLVVTHWRDQTTYMYRNNSNSNHWLAISLEGRISNRSAIGAKVRLEAVINGTRLRQLRHISGGDGLGSQNDPRACFGLGNAERADTLTVEWPSGVRQSFHDVAANQVLHIVEQLEGPVVFLQPESLLLRPGSNGIFQATVTGTTPMIYQWFKNDVPIPGATNLSLAVTNVQLADDGAYALSASNSFGDLMSSNAALTVLIRPTITVQPVSQSVVSGGSVTLSVAATGHPLPISFRWRRGGTTLTNMILNDTNCFITLPNITNQFTCTVAITNLAGNAFVSSNAVITVLTDADMDGLPDEWEAMYGLTSASQDADGDGQSNLNEYRACTNPTNAVDVLHLGCTRDGLRFEAQPTRTYCILGSRSLDGPWTTVLNVPAQTVTHEVHIPWPTTNGFFRLQVP